MKRNPITKEGYAALREELARLKKHERPKIIAAIEEPTVIKRILTHLALPARAPPRSPARPLALFHAA